MRTFAGIRDSHDIFVLTLCSSLLYVLNKRKQESNKQPFKCELISNYVAISSTLVVHPCASRLIRSLLSSQINQLDVR